ncbi:MAG: 4-hydroxythreonine-4-phosphate dehydrogenase PdxA [Bacteroidales bacterium]|nr:4-hydroxythreonine-4-phosphate dehydrogenase PdxA [Bacteroidales bacterium]
MEEEQKIRVGIAQGDVNGIGFELILKALAEPEAYDNFVPIIYGSPKAAAYHRKALNIQNFSLNNIREASEAHNKRANIVTCADDNIHVELGKTSQFADEAALEALKAARQDLRNGKIDVLVCAPMNVSDPNKPEGLQLYVKDNLRVCVVADNVSINNVAQYITKERITSALRTLDKSLKNDFTIRRPRIAVLSLNPKMGEEEQNIITPAIEEVSAENIYAMGPYSADALFGSDAAFKFDAILAMYSDQGIAPFKALAYESGATLTIGNDQIETRTAHGPEYEKAGQDMASCESFNNALYLAINTFRNRKINKEISANPMQTRSHNETEKNA